VGIRSFKIGWLAKGAVALATVAFLVAAAMPANAASLRRGSQPGANGNGANGGPTGNYLFTWYSTGTGPAGPGTTGGGPEPFGNGDSALRLVDPNGCGNGFTTNPNCSSEVDLCAMIYVFDDDQEMGECCGCRITPNELLTFSTVSNLTNNWGLGVSDNGSGTIVVVGSAINDPGLSRSSCGNTSNATCNAGCSPTVAAVTTGDTNLDGSMTHNQIIGTTSGLTEIPLFDQGAGDSVNDAYLVAQCASITGNGSRASGFCHCPTDDSP